MRDRGGDVQDGDLAIDHAAQIRAVEDDRDAHVLLHGRAVHASMSAVVGENDVNAIFRRGLNQTLNAAEGFIHGTHVFLAQPTLRVAGLVRPAQVGEGKIELMCRHLVDGRLGDELIGLLITEDRAGEKRGYAQAARLREVFELFPVIEEAAFFVPLSCSHRPLIGRTCGVKVLVVMP